MFQGARQRRQTSDPHTNGRHEFLDGYRYGSIHYSGDQSQVRKYETVCVGTIPDVWIIILIMAI